MLAARDQENLVHGHRQAAAAKPLNQGVRGLQPKTPGNKFPKTPLKLPLNDENAPGGFGGKSGKGKGIENLVTGKRGTTFDKNAFVTPMGPRTRAPLGNKTTNAKAKVFQTPAGPAPDKELDKTQAPKTSSRRPKKVTHGETVKLQIHGDESPLVERDVEYAPPKPKDLPYDSEDFPRGCLNYDVLKPENLMRGIFNVYHNEVDNNGLTKIERQAQEGYQKSVKECEASILEMIESDENWTVGDVPETFKHLKKKDHSTKKPMTRDTETTTIPTRTVSTIASRKAATALSVSSKSLAMPNKTSNTIPKATGFLSQSKPVSAPLNQSTMRRNAAAAASKSTIGYTKGRSASSVLHKRVAPMARSVSNVSQSSDKTITPANFCEQKDGPDSEDWSHLKFLAAFDVDEDLEPGLRGVLPNCLRRGEEDEDEFVMTLGSSS
ncbi:hypothetical protein B0O99DRAFT_685463 [Bisporella sp. PMI_857]|nr:hypothetical protein B0O99DRAFT_685463 [Bisporella sp. PMI_857]